MRGTRSCITALSRRPGPYPRLKDPPRIDLVLGQFRRPGRFSVEHVEGRSDTLPWRWGLSVRAIEAPIEAPLCDDFIRRRWNCRHLDR